MEATPASAEARHQILISAVAAAVMAPSSHNTQPWRFRIVGGVLEVLADPRRHLTVIDAERRQLVQSCGCALFNARVAVRAMGYADQVTVFPDPQQPDLLATLQLGKQIITDDGDRALMHALPLRRTNRRPFLPRPVALADSDAMIAAAAGDGVWIVRLAPDQKHQVGKLVDRADRLQYRDPAFRIELSSWLTAAGSRRRDGIPFVEKEYGSAMPFSVMRALRSPGLGDSFGRLEEELVRGSPVVMVLGTDGDAPWDWLAAGQALQGLLLDATGLGLAAAFLNQALELPDLRAEVARSVGRAGQPQMILRLGYPEEPIHRAAPRRSLDDVLLIVE